MLKRYVKEYGNDKVKQYERVAAESPRLLEDCQHRIERILGAVKAYERYMITADEAISVILEA